MHTKERLARAMVQAGCPAWMVKRARDGRYDDFESDLLFPSTVLYHDLRRVGQDLLADRVVAGEFDGTKEEGTAWIMSRQVDDIWHGAETND